MEVVTPIRVIDCSTAIINDTPINDIAYTLGDSTAISLLMTWSLTNANGNCGPITYTFTDNNGVPFITSAFTFHPTLNILSIYSTDLDDIATYNCKVTGTLAYGTVTAS